MNEAERIAAGLTKAQQRSLLAMPLKHTFKPRDYVRVPATWACLKSLRLIRPVSEGNYGCDAYSLVTQLGLSVRRILSETPHAE